MSEQQNATGTVHLFHPRGPRVTLPLPSDAVLAFAAVTAALDAGFLASAPGLEEGEEKEQIGWALCGSHEKDGEATPFVLLYSANEALTWSILKVYLNTKTDIDAFEYASGMRLDKIPEYIGDNKPQRGAAQKTDQFIVKAPRPFGVVFKKNPKHDDTEQGKMKPARLFVRWEKERPPEPAAPQQQAAAARQERPAEKAPATLPQGGQDQEAQTLWGRLRRNALEKDAASDSPGLSFWDRLERCEAFLREKNQCAQGALLGYVSREAQALGLGHRPADWEGPSFQAVVEAAAVFVRAADLGLLWPEQAQALGHLIKRIKGATDADVCRALRVKTLLDVPRAHFEALEADLRAGKVPQPRQEAAR